MNTPQPRGLRALGRIGMALLWGIVGWPLGAAAPSPALYEEDPTDSMPIREQQWRQMLAYIGRLERDQANPSTVSAVGKMRSAQDSGALFRQRIGYPPPGLLDQPGPIRLEKAGEDHQAIYYRCYIAVTPEMETYGLYLVPQGVRGPVPLVIAQHGGGGYPELATFRGGANYHDLVRGPVARGWIVFAPHHIFYPYGDRDRGTPLPKEVREELDHRLREVGTTLAAVEVAKISKALDVLLPRPEIDADRVAMAGLSYGGFYTLYTAALEPRIRAAVASCSFVEWGLPTNAPVRPSDFRPGGRLGDASPVELAGLIAPRPLQAQAGRGDTLFAMEAARSLATLAVVPYQKAGVTERFAFAEFDGGHEFRGDLAWPFLERHLGKPSP